MNLKEIKKPLILITYAILLYTILNNLKLLGNSVSYIISGFSALFTGIAFAFVLNLLMKFYEEKFLDKLLKNKNHKLKRAISMILTYLSAIIILFIIVMVIIPKLSESIISLTNNIPAYMENLGRYLEQVADNLGIKDTLWAKLMDNFDHLFSNISKYLNFAFSGIINFTVNITTGIFSTIIGIVFSVYMLADKEHLILSLKKCLYCFLGDKTAEKICNVFTDSNKIFSSFVGGQIVEAFILGALCFIGMSILKLPYAPLISVLIGVTSLIPILGAYLGLIPSAFLILMVNPMSALWFVVFIIILQQIEGNLIYPKVVGNAIGLNGFFVLLAITIGSSFFGTLGILLSVPVMAVLYTLLRRFVDKKITKL